VASLVHAHRRKFKPARFESIEPHMQVLVMRLAVILRLAVLFHRDRKAQAVVPAVQLSAQGNKLQLNFPEHWLTQYPLTAADLEREQDYLSGCGFTLLFR